MTERKSLTPEQVKQQVEIVCGFLSAVHPSLTNNSDTFRPCVELRPIPRGHREYMLTRSINIWDLSEETKQRLLNFFERHNGQATCIYYSVFTYDNFKKTLTKRGTEAKTGKITTSSALYTSEIALDFDGIDFGGYTALVDRFEEMGIYALWVFTGHGYQAHILLDKSLADKDILRRFVYLARAKGFSCDPSCIDPARVMRLPGTYNCKAFSDEAYAFEKEDPPYCEIMQETDARYDLEKLIGLFEALPTVSEEDEQYYLEPSQEDKAKEKTEKASAKTTTKKSKKQTKQPTTLVDDTVQVKRIEYPYIRDFELPDAMTRMLSYTPLGYRNKVLGFLLKHFKKRYRLGKDALLSIFTLWAKEACDPPYPEEEFKSDFSRFYYRDGLNYDTALARKFGSIDFENLIQIRKRDILLPHKFFDALGELSGQAVRVYLAIKLLEHIDEICTSERISELLGLSDRALRTTLKELTESKFAYLKKGVARRKIPNTYHSDHFNTAKEGYVPFSYNDIRAYVTELYEPGSRGNGELKLYLFMRGKFYSGDIFISQTSLGTKLGLAQNSISVIVNRLQERHFLKIDKVYRSGLESCVYTLLR